MSTLRARYGFREDVNEFEIVKCTVRSLHVRYLKWEKRGKIVCKKMTTCTLGSEN